ncbi:glycosyltransferase family 4 protein [Citrobacter amalonaticus]|uniref:glycosyltransferase family 4 protein n=1 Tax=Citrobacter amalonaticus TaxID=35703 RepID=UPI0023AFF30B|nr:glycosyltransferase family 4 protein [Citrobacter amalonaticus]
MKILLISNMYPSNSHPSLGVFVKNIEDILLLNHHEVDKIVIDRKYSSKPSKILSYFLFYFRVFWGLMFKKYDIVYAHYISHVALPIIVFNRVRKIIIYSHAHGGDIKKLNGTSGIFFKIKRFLSKKMLFISTVVFAPSNSYKKFISDSYSLNSNKIVIFPSGGVDTQVFNYSDTDSKKTGMLGYAGRLEKTKNVDLLIKSLVLNDLKLSIVGSGSCEHSLKILVNELGLGDRVTFSESMNQIELAQWYKEIAILVYPSSSESLGLVPLEALACGTSVLLSPIDAFNELLKCGFEFEVIKDFTPEAINFGVQHIISNDNVNISRSNSHLVEKLYSRDVVCKGFIDVFK